MIGKLNIKSQKFQLKLLKILMKQLTILKNMEQIIQNVSFQKIKKGSSNSQKVFKVQS